MGLGRGAGATRSPVGAARTTGSEAPRLQGCTGRPGGVGGGVVLRRVTHGVPGLPVQPWLSRERAKYRNVTTEPTAGGWLRSSSDSPVPRKNRTPVAAGVGRPAGSDGKPRHCPARRGRWGGGSAVQTPWAGNSTSRLPTRFLCLPAPAGRTAAGFNPGLDLKHPTSPPTQQGAGTPTGLWDLFAEGGDWETDKIKPSNSHRICS